MILRAYSTSDAQAIHEAVEESRDELAPFFDWGRQQRSIEERQAGLMRGAAGWILRNEFGFGIWRIEDGRFLGDIGLYAPDWRLRRFEIGYWLRTSELGRGYVTEAGRLLCNLAFDVFEAQRVVIQCDADNVKSAGVPRRIGFELEGTLRNNSKKPSGEVVDSLMFGMTPDRWRLKNCGMIGTHEVPAVK